MPNSDDVLEEVVRPLTQRQRQILQLMATEGLSHKQIAHRLGIGRRTVSNHMVAIYDKLRVRPRRAVVALLEAWRRGEISL